MQHRDFRWFFVATMLAMMADNIEHVISYWLLFQKFHSPVLAGFADISHWTPFLLLSVYFGGIADRYDCRKVIQSAQIMYMAVSVAWAVLFYTETIQDIEGPERANIVWIQDYAVQSGQGPVETRRNETLGLSDRPLILQRKVWVRELQALADGKPLTQWTRSERLAELRSYSHVPEESKNQSDQQVSENR